MNKKYQVKINKAKLEILRILKQDAYRYHKAIEVVNHSKYLGNIWTAVERKIRAEIAEAERNMLDLNMQLLLL